MITGFEQETAALTDEELAIVPGFCNGLSTKIGKDKAITSREIIRKYREHGIKLTGPRIRKIVNHIRTNRLLERVCATSDGYFIAANSQELEDYKDSLRGRIRAIEQVLNSL